MDEDKVSIIIPVYNAEKYIEEAIESALNQTYSNIEVIAVDDGSEDKSLEIMKKFSNRIKIITNEHRGQAHTLNSGIRAMTGDWFKWLSADDLITPDAIEEQINVAKELKNKKQWMIASNYYTIDSDGKLLAEMIAPNFNEKDNFELNVILLHHNIVNNITILIHKSTLENYGNFDENFEYILDWEMWLRYCILCDVKIFFIPKFLAKKRFHDESLTSKIFKSSRISNMALAREHVLGRLNLKERQKYETALNHYREKVDNMRKKIQELNNKIKEVHTERDKDFLIRRSIKSL